jgi:hypothetical protein
VDRVRHRAVLLILAISLGMGGLSISASAATAATAYLRPNADIGAANGWAVVGGSSRWEVLDDAVTESETPNTSDYISNSTFEGTTNVDLQSLGIAGATSIGVSAWFYMPTTQPIRMLVREGSGAKHAIGSGNFTGAGWHSVTVETPISQTQLDALQLEFSPVAQHLTPGPHQVSAAFLKLTYTPSPTKLYWGSWIDGHVYTTAKELEEGKEKGDAPWELSTWEAFKAHTGEKAPSIIHFGQPAPWNQSFSAEPLKKASERGAIPLMDMDSDGIKLTELLEGKKDADFKKWAEAAKAYERPFFFRWEWEMNLAGSESANNPANYVAVWQRIHNIAETAGAKNITWVWCPNVSYTGSASLKSLYPGNEYVDWTCMDGYNHGTKTAEWSPWTSFKNVFAQTYSELISSEFAGHEKPLMIGETASTEIGGSKSEWIADGLGTTLPQEFPRIKAILWFNWDITDSKATHWDWQIESSPAAQASFANAISSPYFAANTFGELTPLTRIQALP